MLEQGCEFSVGFMYFLLITFLLDRPEITLSPDVKVTSPNPFTIQCNVTGYPLPNVYWINGSNVINSYIFYDGNELTRGIVINQSEAVHSGVYTCVAENEFNTVNDSVMVKVFGKLFM